MIRLLRETMAQNCQSDLDVRNKKFRNGRVHIHGNGDAVRFQLLPSIQERQMFLARRPHIFLQFRSHLFKRQQRDFVKSCIVRMFERFCGRRSAKSGGQALVMIKAGIVVAAGRNINQALKG